jgi:hypothetical protein
VERSQVSSAVLRGDTMNRKRARKIMFGVGGIGFLAVIYPLVTSLLHLQSS